VLAVKLYNAGGRHDVTEKTAFYMGTVHSYLRCRHQESVYYSLLSDLKERHREKFRNFLQKWNLFSPKILAILSCASSFSLLLPPDSYLKVLAQ